MLACKTVSTTGYTKFRHVNLLKGIIKFEGSYYYRLLQVEFLHDALTIVTNNREKMEKTKLQTEIIFMG